MNTPIGSSSGSADLNSAPAALPIQAWDPVETYFELHHTCSLMTHASPPVRGGSCDEQTETRASGPRTTAKWRHS